MSRPSPLAVLTLLTALAAAAVVFLARTADCPLLLPLGIGALAGALLAALQPHPYRAPGLVPAGAVALVVALAWAVLAGAGRGPLVLAGAGAALATLPLLRHLVALHRGGPAWLAVTALALALVAGAGWGWVGPPAVLGPVLLVLALAAAALCWRRFIRPAFETFVECVNGVLYKVTARGPGLVAFPREGPVLVIANHACFADPIWLFKVLPRPVTAMATSVHYDRPVLKQLGHILGVLRVEASGYRREAPELEAAVAALDRGECVMVFPEGQIRRQEGVVRRFGQGVWRILQQRPSTPVVVCWIEGGWGSWTSYANGPPFKGKPIDFRRLIVLSVQGPFVLDAAEMEDGPAVRAQLRRLCLEARRPLGLPPLEGAEPEPAPSAAGPGAGPADGAESGKNP